MSALADDNDSVSDNDDAGLELLNIFLDSDEDLDFEGFLNSTGEHRSSDTCDSSSDGEEYNSEDFERSVTVFLF